MADGVFNIARGRVNELFKRVEDNDPTNSAIVVVLLRVVEADATLQDYDDLGAILAASGNTEADFTNYARKVLDDSDISGPTVDDTNNWSGVTMPLQTWTSAGGAANNTLVKLLVCYDSDTTAGTDANIVPLTFHDYAETTDGSDLIAQPSATGLYRAEDPA